MTETQPESLSHFADVTTLAIGSIIKSTDLIKKPKKKRVFDFPFSLFVNDKNGALTGSGIDLDRVKSLKGSYQSLSQSSQALYSKSNPNLSFRGSVRESNRDIVSPLIAERPSAEINNSTLEQISKDPQSPYSINNIEPVIPTPTPVPVQQQQEEPILDLLPKFKLPNLLLNHLKRQKILLKEAKRPHLPHTRVIIANFLHPDKKIEIPKPPPVDVEEPTLDTKAQDDTKKKKLKRKNAGLGTGKGVFSRKQTIIGKSKISSPNPSSRPKTGAGIEANSTKSNHELLGLNKEAENNNIRRERTLLSRSHKKSLTASSVSATQPNLSNNIPKLSSPSSLVITRATMEASDNEFRSKSATSIAGQIVVIGDQIEGGNVNILSGSQSTASSSKEEVNRASSRKSSGNMSTKVSTSANSSELLSSSNSTPHNKVSTLSSKLSLPSPETKSSSQGSAIGDSGKRKASKRVNIAPYLLGETQRRREQLNQIEELMVFFNKRGVKCISKDSLQKSILLPEEIVKVPPLGQVSQTNVFNIRYLIKVVYI
jgi:hypothetical protein